MGEDAQSIGIDIGGTHLRAALMDGQGKLLQVERYRLTARDPAAMLEQIAVGRRALAKSGAPIDGLPMGVGLAGQINTQQGVVAVAPNLGWHDVPFGSMLHERFGQQVRLVNDLNAIAVGEAAYGTYRGCRELCCVFVGTGTGMGAVTGGAVVEGADGLATELGHTKVGSVTTGRLCGCGERGCLEAYTSGRHLPPLLQAKAAAGLACALMGGGRPLESITSADIDAAAQAKDPAAVALWADVSEMLAQAVGNVVTLFNPAVLVLGGGVLQTAKSLNAQLIARIPAYAARPAQRKLTISDSCLGDDAGIVGAARVALSLPR
jgi:glucokinase